MTEPGAPEMFDPTLLATFVLVVLGLFLIPGPAVLLTLARSISGGRRVGIATGLGGWTTDQIVAAFTTGATPSGRTLGPAMPWTDFANLSKADATDIALYLQSLPAVSNAVPGPGPARACVDKAEECIVGREAPPH